MPVLAFWLAAKRGPFPAKTLFPVDGHRCGVRTAACGIGWHGCCWDGCGVVPVGGDTLGGLPILPSRGPASVPGRRGGNCVPLPSSRIFAESGAHLRPQPCPERRRGNPAGHTAFRGWHTADDRASGFWKIESKPKAVIMQRTMNSTRAVMSRSGRFPHPGCVRAGFSVARQALPV